MGVFPEKQATILLSDMIGFTRRTMKMVPKNADRSALLDYIALKNKSIEYRHGNRKKDVSPDFPKARQTLKQACGVYEGITDRPDLSSERIMEWFWERAPPSPDFAFEGIKMEDKSRFSPNWKSHDAFLHGPLSSMAPVFNGIKEPLRALPKRMAPHSERPTGKNGNKTEHFMENTVIPRVGRSNWGINGDYTAADMVAARAIQ